MKLKVKYSGYVRALTFLVMAALMGGAFIYFQRGQYPGGFLMLAFLSVLVFFGCLYGPLNIVSDSEYIKVRSAYRSWRIRLEEIQSIECFQPTAGAMRICASGGFMGYWGLYREGDVGNYMAFYGKSSDCFLIRLRNGDKYVLGCENPQLMVDDVKEKLYSN